MASTLHIQNDKSTIGVQCVGNVNITGGINIQSPTGMDLTKFDLPRLIDTFKGREEEIKYLNKLYFEDHVKKIVICGLPGIGKTELSKQFAAQSLKSKMMDQVFWVTAESEENLQKSMKYLKYIYENYKNYKVLLIFDNAISRKTILNAEPPNESNYFLLITSYEKDFSLSDDIETLELDLLSPVSAVAVYESFLDKDYFESQRDLFSKLAKIVGYVPLAVQVTACYIRQRKKATGIHFNLQEYIDEIQNIFMNLEIPKWAANSYNKSLFGAIEISITKVCIEDNCYLRDLALNALFVCGFLDPERITFDYLLRMPNIKKLVAAKKNNENMVREALTFLDNFSFISYDPNDSKIIIHRFVQTVLRSYISKHDSKLQSKCYSACLEALLLEDKYYNCIINPFALKYADENKTILYDFYMEHKIEFSNECRMAFRIILRYIVKYNCEDSLKEILTHSGYNKDHAINCIHEFYLIHTAAECNSLNVLKQLLQYDVDINRKKGAMKETPLHAAASKCNIEAIKVLIDHNADINIKDWHGDTPLLQFTRNCNGIKFNDVRKVLDLLQCEKNKNISNSGGKTILHLAAYSCHAELVTLLVKQYKMPVDIQDNHGSTPLNNLISNASSYSRKKKEDTIQTVKALKSCNARLDIKHGWWGTPRQHAELFKVLYLVPYL